MATRTVTQKTLAFAGMAKGLNEAAGNLVGNSRSKKYRRDALNLCVEYVRSVARIAMSQPVQPPVIEEGWKERWANESEAVLLSHGIEELIDQTILTIGQRFPHAVKLSDGIIKYILLKLGTHAGQFSRLILCGLSPEILRMTEEEAVETIIRVHGSRKITLVTTPAHI